MDQQSTRTDITVNVDGFWMLQALLDIRHVAPELRCRPYVSTDNNDWLNEHPGMAVMREQGIVGIPLDELIEARGYARIQRTNERRRLFHVLHEEGRDVGRIER